MGNKMFYNGANTQSKNLRARRRNNNIVNLPCFGFALVLYWQKLSTFTAPVRGLLGSSKSGTQNVSVIN